MILAAIAEYKDELIKKLNRWKDGTNSKGMKINVNKTTHVMINGVSCNWVQNNGRWPCGFCGKGVGRNSI